MSVTMWRSSLANNREWIEEFILIYQSEPCLWKVQSKDYQNPQKRGNAYERLVSKLLEIDSGANNLKVKFILRELISPYRKELQKLKEHPSYVPLLWYFPLMRFLDNTEETSVSEKWRMSHSNENLNSTQQQTKHSKDSTSRMDSQIRLPASAQENSSTSSTLPPKDSPPSSSPNLKGMPNTNGSSSENSVDSSTPPDFQTSLGREEDFYDLFGRVVAHKLRTINEGQRFWAEKIVNDVLFQAQLGNLSMQTRLVHTAEKYVNEGEKKVRTTKLL
ncbi:uncharacterized protein LOC123311998 [Coccinella septempunctata]|uniref:uncharacterized protein LOC123311998 n=1 Tax=Coccinella septempunctata TaxID=41139 RepID=UPI001D091062|nr:uncharacterized protein LOC123311998 [Coccinella septempunctata]